MKVVKLRKFGNCIMISIWKWHHPIRNAHDYLDMRTEYSQLIDYKDYKLSELRKIVQDRI